MQNLEANSTSPATNDLPTEIISEHLPIENQEVESTNVEVEVEEIKTIDIPEEIEEKVEVVELTDANQVEVVVNEISEETVTESKPVVIETSAETANEAEEEIIEEEEEENETPEAAFIAEDEDVTEFSKKDLLTLADKLVAAVKKQDNSIADIRNVDNVAKQIQPIFEEIHTKEKAEALKAYISETGGEIGFDFKNDNTTLRFEAAMADIRESVSKFYRNIRNLRDNYFETKTALLERLRIVVEEEEKGGSKENWNSFKKIQDEWKEAGNINSPHNGSLWSAYNALIDRYFSIRSIQNELKDLDRRKNLELKTEIAEKIEAITAQFATEGYSSLLFKQANELFEEYKAIGPATREEQEALWEKVKSSFDIIYDKKREHNEANKQLQNEILETKQRIVENLQPYLSFDSGSINEWNEKTKELLEIQEQWNSIKGTMPRNEGKEVSKAFWGSLKQFFKNKSDFFNKLEAERENNLKAKLALCDELEAIISTNDAGAENTNKVIELQKTWRTIGHVPQKQKDTAYKKFKKLADTFFNNKRSENSEQEKEYEENLKAKIAICEEVEKLTSEGNVDLSLLSDFKNKFGKIGFVPRKDMKSIQSRFIDAINNYVKSISSISKKEEEHLLIKNQVDVVIKSGNSSKSLSKQENDLKRKAQTLESDISLWRNNIEFFGHSKGAEKMKAEFEKKIVKAENELKALNEKISLIGQATNS